MKRTTDIVGEIAASSREQSTGIEQVNTAVTQMDAVTQSNASQAEELAGTAEGLSGQAQTMMTLVKQFTISGGRELAEEAEAAAKAKARSRPHAKVLPMRKAGIQFALNASLAGSQVSERAATGTDGFEEF